ncbi:MAG: MFS transporter [Candidatus Thorarchaeota archaeon]|jgi:MFS family permease
MVVEEGQSEEEMKHNPAHVFGAASFLNDTGSDMIAPIWPTFLTTQLGLTQGQVQIVDGFALMVTALTKLGAGYASDRSGMRKSFITLGYSLSMLARIGFVLATYAYQFIQIVAWKSMDRLGKIRGPPRDAIVAGHVTEKERGRAFGILRALDTAGAVLGTIITFLLFQYLGYTGIILLAAIPTAGSVIVVAVLVKEKRGKDIFKGINFRNLDKNLKIFLAASVVFALATFSYSLLILFSANYGYTVPQQTLLYLLFTAVYAASAYPFGRFSDKYGRKPILAIAFVFLIITAAWVFLVLDPLMIIPMFVFFGLMNGALDPVQTSFVADLVEEERRASIIGAFQMAVGISAFPAGLIIGFLWDFYTTPVFAFTYSIVLTLIALLLLSLVKTRK